MSGEIINLRQQRKRKARAEKEQRAAENRKRFGRPKAERRQTAAESELERRRLEAHARQPSATDTNRDEP
ncbi:MAG: DUF4169 family protein [Hyphomicrobiaceae bacterium]